MTFQEILRGATASEGHGKPPSKDMIRQNAKLQISSKKIRDCKRYLPRIFVSYILLLFLEFLTISTFNELNISLRSRVLKHQS